MPNLFVPVYTEAGLGEKPPTRDCDDASAVASFAKRRKIAKSAAILPASASINNDKSTSSSVSLPHLVYKLDFIKNTISSEPNLWSFAEDNKFTQSIISKASRNVASNQKKIDSKVVVVLELLVGGAVSKYTIRRN